MLDILPSHNKQLKDLIDKYLLHIDNNDRHAILWNLTAFPFCDLEILENQLRDVKDKLDKNISINVQISEVEEEMAKASREYDDQESD